MKWSWKLGRVAGIGIYMHWTFLLLIAWIFLLHLGRGQSVLSALEGAAFVLAIFACVVLHELGHALTARRYGIGTRDITLLPIGGVARLEKMPEEPAQEFWIAIAGPLVNVVIAGLLFVGLWLFHGQANFNDPKWVGDSFLPNLMWVNVSLLVFNLLPAFPMDGGRILRAGLASVMNYTRATRIAATIGQGMAIIFGFLGFVLNPFLLFIALFVFLGAKEEASMVEMKSAINGLSVGDAMIRKFRTLSEDDTLGVAAEELLQGWQHDFPVRRDGHFMGMLTRRDLVKALAREGRRGGVAGVVRQPCGVVQQNELLEKALGIMRQGGCSTLPVLEGESLVGLLTLENVGELLMVHSALDPKRDEKWKEIVDSDTETEAEEAKHADRVLPS